MRSPRAVVAVGCEDFRQNYPKEISADADRLTFHVWPGHGVDHHREPKHDEVVNLYWLHESRLLNFYVPPEVACLPVENWHTSKYFLHFAKRANAMGLMKTHEVKWVFFAPGQTNASIRPHVCAALRPTVVGVDPTAMVQSGVFGSLAARNPERHPEVERALDLAVRAEDRWEKMHRTWGMFIFGGGYSRVDYGQHRFGIYRVWRNMHHGNPRTPWLLFFRSADPFFFLRSIRNTRKVLDLGMCHYVRREPRAEEFDGWQSKTVGGLHDYKGLVPWNAGGRSGDYNSMTDFMLYYTYFTGNAQGRETALKWWRAVTRWVRPGGTSRSGAGTLAAAIELYRDTLDHRMLPFLHAMYKGMCRGQSRPWGYFNEWQNYGPWLERYWCLTGSDHAKQVLCRWADSYLNGYGDASSQYGSYGINILSAAALASGNAKYLRMANRLAHTHAMSTCPDVDSPFYGAMWTDANVSLMSYVMQQLPYVLGARERFGREIGRADGFFRLLSFMQKGKGYTLRWSILDEKDEPIRLLFRPQYRGKSLSLSIAGPDGNVALAREVPCDAPRARGYHRNLPVGSVELPPDGKRGVYTCTLSSRDYPFNTLVPIAEAAREVYPAYDRRINVYRGQAAFAVPKDSGAYTIVGTGPIPSGIHLLDESENVLASSHVRGTQTAHFETTVDSSIHHRFHILSSYSSNATFAFSGKSPPKHYAVSLPRLFDPDAEGGPR